jgi:hypothetical protein
MAGSFAAGALATILAAPWRLGLGPWQSQVHGESLSDRVGGTIGFGLLSACAAFFVALAYVAVLGGLAVVRSRKKAKTPSRAGVLGCGLVTGVLPVVAFPLLLGMPSEFTTKGGPGPVWTVFFFLAVSAIASLATAWTFWRCALAGRVAQ